MQKTRQHAEAEVRPPPDDGPIVMMTSAQLRELVQDAVVAALDEYEAGKQPAPALLSGAAMAQRLGISRTKLHKLRVAGSVRAVKVGDTFRFAPAEVLADLKGKTA